mmetsp:Transcript_49506/g.127715  ORF Transcript_49506/g.127715 Transcript_49506/m.127715 type:complete len:322 (-) Transcript_49506:61-1026(-)
MDALRSLLEDLLRVPELLPRLALQALDAAPAAVRGIVHARVLVHEMPPQGRDLVELRPCENPPRLQRLHLAPCLPQGLFGEALLLEQRLVGLSEGPQLLGPDLPLLLQSLPLAHRRIDVRAAGGELRPQELEVLGCQGASLGGDARQRRPRASQAELGRPLLLLLLLLCIGGRCCGEGRGGRGARGAQTRQGRDCSRHGEGRRGGLQPPQLLLHGRRLHPRLVRLRVELREVPAPGLGLGPRLPRARPQLLGQGPEPRERGLELGQLGSQLLNALGRDPDHLGMLAERRLDARRIAVGRRQILGLHFQELLRLAHVEVREG